MALPFIVIHLFIATSFLSAQAGDHEPHLEENVYVMPAKVTAYCTCKVCCGRYSAGKRTALGTDARKAIGVAASQQLVPFRSHVYIPGLRYHPLRIVDDTGGGMRKMARKGILQFDVRFTSHKAARAFGVHWMDVYVMLNEPDPAQEAFFMENALFAVTATSAEPSLAFEGARFRYAMITE